MGFHTPPLRTVNPIHTMLNTTTARPCARARLATDDAPFDRVPPPPTPHTRTHARPHRNTCLPFSPPLSPPRPPPRYVSHRARRRVPSIRPMAATETSARGSIRSRRAMTRVERRRGRRSSDDVRGMEFIPVRFRRHRSTIVPRRRSRDVRARSRWIG